MPFAPGVFWFELGTGGKESNNDAPKFEEGLNALRPVNPVVCGFNAGDDVLEGLLVAPEAVALVAPVWWLDSDENMESENVDPDAEVGCEDRNESGPEELGRPDVAGVLPFVGPLLTENSEATLAISPLPLVPPIAVNHEPVCCGCCGCC